MDRKLGWWTLGLLLSVIDASEIADLEGDSILVVICNRFVIQIDIYELTNQRIGRFRTRMILKAIPYEKYLRRSEEISYARKIVILVNKTNSIGFFLGPTINADAGSDVFTSQVTTADVDQLLCADLAQVQVLPKRFQPTGEN